MRWLFHGEASTLSRLTGSCLSPGHPDRPESKFLLEGRKYRTVKCLTFFNHKAFGVVRLSRWNISWIVRF
jgi:hypothetical protein